MIWLTRAQPPPPPPSPERPQSKLLTAAQWGETTFATRRLGPYSGPLPFPCCSHGLLLFASGLGLRSWLLQIHWIHVDHSIFAILRHTTEKTMEKFSTFTRTISRPATVNEPCWRSYFTLAGWKFHEVSIFSMKYKVLSTARASKVKLTFANNLDKPNHFHPHLVREVLWLSP